MLVLDDGQRIVVGDADQLSLGTGLTMAQWLLAMGLVSAVLPLFSLYAIMPAALGSPLMVVLSIVFSATTLGMLLVVRNVLRMITSGEDVLVAAFDRTDNALNLIYLGIFGRTLKQLDFSDIHAIRMGRGEWSGEMVRQVTVLELNGGGSIVLPVGLSAKDLALLKVLTGIRR